MFSNFFKPKEAQIAINALNLLDPLFKEHPQYKHIKELVSDSFLDSAYISELRKSLYEMKLSPHCIALYAIAATSFRMISTGQFHIYRGVINLEGNSVKNIFVKCIFELEAVSFYSSDEAKKQVEEINSVIKEIG